MVRMIAEQTRRPMKLLGNDDARQDFPADVVSFA
jgi:hypothetical protein